MTKPAFTEVASVYGQRFSEEEQRAKAAVWKVLVESFFQRWIKPSDVVLDLGCGFGEFLNNVKCARRIGVDLNEQSPRCLEAGIEFHLGSVMKLDFLTDNTVDVVFTSNVMEHLPGKEGVEQMLREVRRVLKPGGILIALGPNLRFLPGVYWDFWDHFVPITDRSLTEVLGLLQFKVEACTPKFLPYTTKSMLPQHPFLVWCYLKCPLIWTMLGRQFLIRARKPT